MDKVAKNLYNAGYALPEVSKMTSYNAAKVLSLNDRGEIAQGKRADMILLDGKLNLIKIL